MGDLATILGEINKMGIPAFLVIAGMGFLAYITRKSEKRADKQADRLNKHLDETNVHMDKITQAVQQMAISNTTLTKMFEHHEQRLGRIEHSMMQK